MSVVLGTVLMASAAGLDVAAASPERCPPGVAGVFAEGRAVWCAESRDVELATRTVWSRDRGAVAFAARNGRGELTLVVVLVGGEADGHAMRWPIPSRVLLRRRGSPNVTWLGEQQVAFGFSEVRPELVASWRLRSW